MKDGLSSDEGLRERIRALIEKAVRFAYTSRSCHNNIATGMLYQTLQLGDETVGGFRSRRDGIFDLFDFTDKVVLDIGSNLGQLSRDVLARGARHVTGLEYDPLFVLIADLVSAYNDLDPARYAFVQGDVTKQFRFDQAYDFVLAFSVFTYMGHRLPEIAAATGEALVLETHNAEEGWEATYVRPTLAHFPVVIRVSDSDWGTAQRFASGRRHVLACCKNRHAAWRVIQAIQERRPDLSTLHRCEVASVRSSVIESFRPIMAAGRLDEFLAIPDDRLVHEAMGRPLPTHLSDPAYWMEFHRGFDRFRRDGKVVTEGNGYARMLARMVGEGSAFDPGAAKQMQGPGQLAARVARRFEDMARLSEGRAEEVPAIALFNVQGKEPAIRLTTEDGEALGGTTLDGFHRLASSALLGLPAVPVYALDVYGAL